LITTYQLPESMFSALAAGGGDPAVVCYLSEVQQSKHMMLLHAVGEAAAGVGADVFRAGYDLLARLQQVDPGSAAWLFRLPHFGGWVHDCLVRIKRSSEPDFGYLACLAAAAGRRARTGFELEVPARDGRIALPGFGWLDVGGEPRWVRLSSDGEQLTAVGEFTVRCDDLIPGGGLPIPSSPWHGTPRVTATADDLTLDVLLETSDLRLDRYNYPMARDLKAAEIDRWQDRIRAAWEILVRHHRPAAESIAAGVSVIIPLRPQSESDLVSATTPAAFGAIATSWPPDPVTLAETLVHEFQHVKLCGLMDMVALVEPGGPTVYAPWRQDPRPAGGLLQGIYAHAGIVRFWAAQRRAETDPDAVFRAQVQFARWLPAIDTAAGTLLETGSLTPAGVRFIDVLRAQARSLRSEAVSGPAQMTVNEVTLDHQLGWALRHTALPSGYAAELAAAYQSGAPRPGPLRPASTISAGAREVGPAIRSRLLSLRYLEPARYRTLRADGVSQLSQADVLLMDGEPSAAVHAYRDQIAGCADPQPDAWIGLALAVHRLPPSPLHQTFAENLALLFDIHVHLSGQHDPVELASWLT